MASTAHQDFKGHHPEIRPHIPHRRKEVNKVTIAGEEIVYGEAGIGYVDTSGYGMLQANDAEPPPKQGWLCRVLQCAAVALFGAMLFTGPTSCNKDPQPTPVGPTPIDTITPVVPNDTITPGDTIVPTPPTPGDTIDPEPPVPMDTVRLMIKRDNVTGGISYPSMDTIRKYLHMDKIVVLGWYVPPNLTNGWTPDAFHSPRDSLRARFAISPKIIGNGIIYVNENYGGASIPCADSLNISVLGMTECDSAIFAGWGYRPTQLHFGKSRDNQIKFIDTVGMSRAILGRSR